MSNDMSVEEVAALLGTAINRLHQANGQTFKTVAPPPGLPSVFSTVNPIPCRELYDRLVSLRAILRSLAGKREEEERKTHSWSLSRQGDALRCFVAEMSLRNGSSSNSSATSSSYPSFPAAPSILQLLLKLLSISSSLAQTPVLIHSSTSSINSSTASKNATTAPIRITPPLSSPVLRTLWVECVVLCHRLSPLTSPSSFDSQNLPGVSMTGVKNASTSQNTNAKILSIYQEYASANPKASKALGGTRIACLLVLNSLFSDICVGQRLLPYANAVLNLCHRALKSSGAHDAVHRVEAVRCASAVALAIRWAHLQRTSVGNGEKSVFWCNEAMDDSMILESVKLLKRSAEDSVPEVRKAGAEFVSILSSMLIHNVQVNGAGSYVCSNPDVAGTNPLLSIDDVLQVIFKNIDDVSPAVAILWAESLARCICTVVEYHETLNRGVGMDATQKRRSQDNDADRTPTRRTQSGFGSNTASDLASKFRALTDVRAIKSTTLGISCSMCTSLALALSSVKNLFIKVGGETNALKLGGLYSVGGRSVRVGIGTTMMFLIQLQSICGGISSNGSMNTTDALATILGIVGKDLESMNAQVPEKVLNLSISDSALSCNDVGLCVFTACRVLRRLSETSSEATQLSLLRDLSQLCLVSKGICNDDDARTYIQLQVALVETSNLLIALGEAAVSALDDLVPALNWCLSSPDRVVRHEAAVAYQALAHILPSAGRRFIIEAVDEIQLHIDEVISYAVTKKEFMLLGQNYQTDTCEPIHRTFSVHGYALALSLALNEIPRKEGGLSSDMFDTITSLATTLIQCQYDKTLVTAFALGACEYALAGWTIISAAISLGPIAVNHFSERLFDAWSQFTKPLNTTSSRIPWLSELRCFDAKLKSVVVFLKYCSPMLLSHNRALASTVLFAEKCLMYLRDDAIFSDEIDQFLKDSLRSSLMELFSWLPPGTYPHLADELFSFSTTFLRKLSFMGVSCSLVPSLLTTEENLLYGASLTHCDNLDQTGGAFYLDENISSLKTDYVRVSERESVIPFISWNDKSVHLSDRSLVEATLMYGNSASAPTPLHLVGNWRRPPSPSTSSCVRLVDASIHLFSVLFGMRDGLEQDSDIRLLDELASTSAQNIKVLMNSAVSEKNKQVEEIIQINVSAALLSCLYSVPTAEESSDNTQTAGPPWMKKAASLLLKFSSSQLPVLRRVGAEGLALLSSLGVVEDAYLIQSSIIHSLGSIIDSGSNLGSAPNRKSASESVDQAKSGAVLAIGCIQRTAWFRTRKILTQEVMKNDVGLRGESVIIMLTRILPAVATYSSENDSIVVRTYALQAWTTLLQYSDVFDTGSYTLDLQCHLLYKSIEIIENNFFASWTTVICDETERVEYTLVDISYLAVLIRLLTCLTRRLNILHDENRNLQRFATMVHSIVHASDFHSVILQEALSFMKQVHSSIDILSSDLSPILFRVLSPSRPQVLSLQGLGLLSHFSRSLSSQKSSLQIFNTIPPSSQQRKLFCMYLFAMIDTCWGTQGFSYTNSRFMLIPRNHTIPLYEIHSMVSAALDIQLNSQMRVNDALQDSLTLANSIMTGVGGPADDCNFLSGPTRWQVKFEAVRLSIAVWLKLIADKVEDLSPLNIENILLASCSMSMSTSDQSDLCCLQGLALQLLKVTLSSLVDLYPTTFHNYLSEKITGVILLAVKHALNILNPTEKDTIISEGLPILFRSGCKCLPIICELGILSDPTVFKRLVQALMGVSSHSPFPNVDETNPLRLQVLGTNNPIVLTSKVYALSQIYMLSKLNIVCEAFFLCIESELLSQLHEFCILSAVLAVDDYNDKEKYGSNTINLDSHHESSPYLSSFSLSLFIHLIEALKMKDDLEIEKKLYYSWLEPVSAIVITEFYWYLGNSAMTPCIEYGTIIATYLRSLSELAGSEMCSEIFGLNLSPMINAIFNSVLFPYFDSSWSAHAAPVVPLDNPAVIEACGFILSICRASCVQDMEKKWIISFLIPLLDKYQRPPDHVAIVIVKAIDHLLTHCNRLLDEISNSILLSFTLRELSLLNKGVMSDSSTYHDILFSILRLSFTSQSMSVERQRSIVYQNAVSKQWKLWLTTCLSLRNPADIACSIPAIQEQLCDLGDAENIQSLLSAIIQLASERIDCVPSLIFYLGHKMVEALLIYGMCRLNCDSARLAISSDVIKFLILSFQFLDNSRQTDGCSVQFLALILESLVSLIQYNGLPDENSGNSHADPSIGRICAQSFVSLARYSQLKLKESMMQLSLEQTLVVESAMRADIAGYVKAASIGKKKIDLKGYIK